MTNYPPPAAPIGPSGQVPPPNNLVWAILTTLFCCLPFGVVSIVYAAQVNGKFMAGDIAGAQESSKKAKTWAIVSAASGAVVLVVYFVFLAGAIATLGTGADTSGF